MKKINSILCSEHNTSNIAFKTKTIFDSFQQILKTTFN